MYPIYCGHKLIEKMLTDTGDLIVNCVACPAMAMWHRTMIPDIPWQVPGPWIVGVLKTTDPLLRGLRRN